MSIRTAALWAGLANLLTLLLTLRGGFFAIESLTVIATGAWAAYFFTVWRSGDARWPAVAVLLTSSAFTVWFLGWGGLSPIGIYGWVDRARDWAEAAALALFLAATALRAPAETLRKIAAAVFVLTLFDAIQHAYRAMGVFENVRNGTFAWAFKLSVTGAMLDQVLVPASRLLYWASQVLYFRAVSREGEQQSRAILGLS